MGSNPSAGDHRAFDSATGDPIHRQLDEPIINQNPRAWLDISCQVLVGHRNVGGAGRCDGLGTALATRSQEHRQQPHALISGHVDPAIRDRPDTDPRSLQILDDCDRRAPTASRFAESFDGAAV